MRPGGSSKHISTNYHAQRATTAVGVAIFEERVSAPLFPYTIATSRSRWIHHRTNKIFFFVNTDNILWVIIETAESSDRRCVNQCRAFSKGITTMATDMQALDLSDTVVTGRRRDGERRPMEVMSQPILDFLSCSSTFQIEHRAWG